MPLDTSDKSEDFKLDLTRRPRRLRRTAALRKMVQETILSAGDLIAPLIVKGSGGKEPVASMPGLFRLSIDELVAECAELAELGVPAVAIFPNIEAALKDAVGSEAENPEGLILRATRAIKAALPHMKAKGRGRILFTSSITGPSVTSPGHGHYAASKAGINGFIRSAALEFAGYGITVNGVEPGNILTEGMQAHRSAAFIRSMEEAIPVGRMGTPRDVANAFLFLASDEADFITGTTIVVDGGQILPEGNDFRLQPQ